MFCRTRENFTTNTTTIDDVASQGEKNIMLTDADGNISLVKFSDTVIKLQEMINALNETVQSQKVEIEELQTTLESLSASAIKHDDQIKISTNLTDSRLVLNHCGADSSAPCRGGSVHYVSASNSDQAMNSASNNQWTIQKYVPPPPPPP